MLVDSLGGTKEVPRNRLQDPFRSYCYGVPGNPRGLRNDAISTA
jgi:hypothetical protein